MTENLSSDYKQTESKFQQIIFKGGMILGYMLAAFLIIAGIAVAFRDKNIGIFFIFLLLALADVVFPLWVATRARSRGRMGWAIATIIVTFLVYGVIIALVVLFIPAKLRESHLDTQCPKCNGVKGFIENTTFNRKTGTPALTLTQAILWGLFALVLIGFGLGMAILTWQEGDSGFIQWQYGSTLAGFGVLAFGVGFGRFGVMGVLEYINAERVEATKYKCSNCGHKWNNFQADKIEAQ